MNLKEFNPKNDKEVVAKNILNSRGSATMLFLKKDGVLPHHQSITDALLILLEGKALYEEEDRNVVLNEPFDFVQIPGKVQHKLSGIDESMLILIQ